MRLFTVVAPCHVSLGMQGQELLEAFVAAVELVRMVLITHKEQSVSISRRKAVEGNTTSDQTTSQILEISKGD